MLQQKTKKLSGMYQIIISHEEIITITTWMINKNKKLETRAEEKIKRGDIFIIFWIFVSLYDLSFKQIFLRFLDFLKVFEKKHVTIQYKLIELKV